MYNPDWQAKAGNQPALLSSSIWIPVGWMQWSWTATARYDSTDPNPHWEETAASQDKVDYAATREYPNWTANRTNSQFSTWFDV